MEAPDLLAPLRELVERGLRELDPILGDLAAFSEAIRYPLLAGGKRIRPVLCLAAGETLGLGPVDLLPTALALELVHTFSLVHDDLPAMDDDDLRRGLPTTHKRYGEDVAILVGDALLARAFQVLIETTSWEPERLLELVHAFGHAIGAGGMIGGQYLDVRPSENTDEAGLERLHGKKTGRLLVFSAMCPVILLDPPSDARSFHEFASELGMLFQIVDDILDVTGSAVTLGKSAGKDARQGRQTYVSVLGLDGARARAAAREARARAAGRPCDLRAAERQNAAEERAAALLAAAISRVLRETLEVRDLALACVRAVVVELLDQKVGHSRTPRNDIRICANTLYQ
jgi:geranylgeranyl diphosphate synthase, type II